MYIEVKKMKLVEAFYRNNIWWNNKKLSESFLYKIKRQEFFNIVKYLEEKRILAVVGPRRVGIKC